MSNIEDDYNSAVKEIRRLRNIVREYNNFIEAVKKLKDSAYEIPCPATGKPTLVVDLQDLRDLMSKFE